MGIIVYSYPKNQLGLFGNAAIEDIENVAIKLLEPLKEEEVWATAIKGREKHSEKFKNMVVKDYVESWVALRVTAKTHNISVAMLMRWLKELGCSTKNTNGVDPKIINSIINECAEGMVAIADLSKKYGVSKQTIRKYLIDNKIKIPSNFKEIENELWKPIGYTKGYSVSNYGRVKNSENFLMKVNKTETGYFISLRVAGEKRQKDYPLAMLVARAFLSNYEDNKFVAFKDGDCFNVSPSNLEWSAIADNQCTYSIAIRKMAVQEYLDGATCKELSFKYKAADTVIRTWILKSGNKMRNNSTYSKTPITISNSVIADFKNGLRAYGELAEKHGLCTKTVLEILKENGLNQKSVNVERKKEVRRLYIEENLNCCDIAKITGVNNRTVLGWVSDVKRSKSEISATLAMQGKKHHFGRKENVATRFGVIHADSSYEKHRLLQLDADTAVANLRRCDVALSYVDEKGKERKYNPDFFIETNDGVTFMEEVKPSSMIDSDTNLRKKKAAMDFCAANNYTYRIIMEIDIFGAEWKKELSRLHRIYKKTKNDRDN